MALLAHDQKENSVQYSGGILCYMHQDMVRILDVHGASDTEDVIDMKALMAGLPGHDPSKGSDFTGRIHRYQNGILTMIIDGGPVYGAKAIMAVIDVRRSFVPTQGLSRIQKLLQDDPVPNEVITDGRYLICVYLLDRAEGDGISRRKALEKTLKCYDLSNPTGSASIIALGEFLPSGFRYVFKLFGGWLYAISGDQEGEFTAGSSERRLYYHCCRFPIDDFGPAGDWEPGEFLNDSPYTPLPARLEAVRLFRGMYKDVWALCCEDLVQDERTGEIFLVEPQTKDPSKIETKISAYHLPRSASTYRELFGNKNI